MSIISEILALPKEKSEYKQFKEFVGAQNVDENYEENMGGFRRMESFRSAIRAQHTVRDTTDNTNSKITVLWELQNGIGDMMLLVNEVNNVLGYGG